MTELDFESSQLQLLTDALRAGPGTTEWRAALASIEHAGGGDEYRLLYAARERLASGRQYREVRAGAGFTRKVFDSIEQDEGRAKALPSANLIAAASALAIVAILAVVAYIVMPRGEPAPPQLSQTYFVNTLSRSNFDGELGMDWAAFGPLGVEPRDGLRPVLKDLSSEFRGGGVFYERTLPPEQAFAMEASILLPKASDDVAVQVFVTDDPNFTGDSATSEHELVCLLRGSEASVVLPGGHVEKQGVRLSGGKVPIEVHINVSRDQAAVSVNGRTIWTGPNALDGSKPRLAGVRFLARAGKAGDVPVVQSARVIVPQK